MTQSDTSTHASRPNKKESSGSKSARKTASKRRRHEDHTSIFASAGDACICNQITHEAPHEFPPERRELMVTKRWAQVAHRDGEWLFCDSSHPGAHIWPSGDLVEES